MNLRGQLLLTVIKGVIYKEFGPIRMQYDRCDMSDNHWVSGWEVSLSFPTTFAQIRLTRRYFKDCDRSAGCTKSRDLCEDGRGS